MAHVSFGSDGEVGQGRLRLLTVCGGTDIGSRRQQNQDTFVIADLESGSISRPCVRTDVSVSRPGLLLLVCDGMGGAAAGDVAARVAAASIQHELEAAGPAVVRSPGPSLEHAMVGANQAVFNEAQEHPEERGMGTTCTAAIVSPDRVSIAQVGDSRAYLLRDGQLRALTRDQNIASELMGNGVISSEDIARSPFRHLLSQAVGTKDHLEPVRTDQELREGDRLLLCSDGLHGPVSDKAIADIMNNTPDPFAAAQGLIAAALAAGGPDNVTVVVANCGPLRRETTLH
ncbi:MAG TPA: protein phosphatase 2C domain-containing protein [Polyangia bacterium]|jgi:protein phosphatase|nr:protein phosphatase 2C domain-containing protein [Polyangia bacterium]